MPSWFVSWCMASEQGRQMLLGCSFSMPQPPEVRIGGLAIRGLGRGVLFSSKTCYALTSTRGNTGGGGEHIEFLKMCSP